MDGLGFLGGLVPLLMMLLIYAGAAYLVYWIIRKAVKAGILDAQKQMSTSIFHEQDE